LGEQAPNADVVRIEGAGSGCILHLGPSMDLRAATPLRDALLGIEPALTPVRIEADSVVQITTPCVQVLLAAQRSLESESRQLVLDSASDSFIKAFADLGLFSVIAQWQPS
jgi:anti-anti-sigma regulatory factor